MVFLIYSNQHQGSRKQYCIFKKIYLTRFLKKRKKKKEDVRENKAAKKETLFGGCLGWEGRGGGGGKEEIFITNTLPQKFIFTRFLKKSKKEKKMWAE